MCWYLKNTESALNSILSTLLCIVCFTFMHLADAFIQSDLQLHSGYTFSLVRVFPGNTYFIMDLFQILGSLEVVALTFPAGYPLACYVDHIGT